MKGNGGGGGEQKGGREKGWGLHSGETEVIAELPGAGMIDVRRS